MIASHRTRRPVHPLVYALVVAYLALLAYGVVHVQNAFGEFHPVGLAVLALLPLAAYVTFRAPLVFPFGAYVVLVPFDSILMLSSGATITRLVAIFAGVALLSRMLFLRRVERPGAAWFAWLAFVGYTILSFLWTPDQDTAKIVFQQTISLFLMMTIVAMYPATKTEIRGLVATIVASGVAAALYSVHLYQSGAVNSENRISLSTDSGLTIDPNYFATSFVLPIAFAMGGAFYARAPLVRIACAGAALLATAGSLVSGSRGGFIAILIVFAYFVFRSRHRFVALGFCGLGLALTAFFPSVWARFANDPSAAGSGSGRTFIWQTGMHSFGDHWLFGGGIGSFATFYDRALLQTFQPVFQGWSRPSHSIVVGTLTEYGVVGLALVMYAWWRTFREARRIGANDPLFGLRVASEAAILGLFSQAFFLDTIFIKYYWLAYTMPLALVGLAERRRVR